METFIMILLILFLIGLISTELGWGGGGAPNCSSCTPGSRNEPPCQTCYESDRR